MCLGLLAVATKSRADVKELKIASNMVGVLKNYVTLEEASLGQALILRAKLRAMTWDSGNVVTNG
jgi:hypothetical protein